jgi:ribosomal protein L22
MITIGAEKTKEKCENFVISQNPSILMSPSAHTRHHTFKMTELLPVASASELTLLMNTMIAVNVARNNQKSDQMKTCHVMLIMNAMIDAEAGLIPKTLAVRDVRVRKGAMMTRRSVLGSVTRWPLAWVLLRLL